jgi:hypothetical protein
MLRSAVVIFALAVGLLPASASAAPVQRPGGNYYEYVPGALDWETARQSAENRHGKLVTIADAAENAYVLGLIGDSPTWLGARDDADDTDAVFTWVTGEPFAYTNFHAGEPDDDAALGGQGEALVMGNDGQWSDTDPGASGLVGGFVVEWPAATYDIDGDGLFGEDPDDDNDGVLNATDNCPRTSNADQTDSDHDSLGDACDADDDGDGTADVSDAYPLDPTRSSPATDAGGPGPSTTTTPTSPADESSTSPPPPDRTPPAVRLPSTAASITLGALRRSHRVRIRITISEPASLVLTATRGGTRVGRVRVRVVAAAGRVVVLTLSPTAIRRGTLRITATATDAAGNTRRATTTIRVR